MVDDDLPQISGKINETFVERVTGVKLREVEHKDGTKNHALSHASTGENSMDSRSRSSRLCLGREILANFTEENIITTLRNTDWKGTLLKKKGQEALDNYFDMRQGKAEAIQDHINRDKNMSLSLQNSPRRCVVAGSSAHQPRQSKRSQVSESSPRDARDCLSAEKRGSPADTRCDTERGRSRRPS